MAGKKGWEELRRESFVRIFREYGGSGISIRPVLADAEIPCEEAMEQIVACVRTFPLPIGIMVNQDTLGVQILDAWRRAGLRVPDDIAVVSVDNDPVLFEVTARPLSRLDQQVNKLGFEAAAMIDKMIRRKKVENRNYFIEPGHVVTRQSSDIIAVDDQRIV